MELLDKLGIDWRLLIAQIINFGILLAVLYKFLYKPVLGLLRKRQEKIEKSLEEAKRIEREAKEISKIKEEKIIEARGESQRIIEEAAKTAEGKQKEIVNEGRKEAEKFLSRAQEEIKERKSEMITDAKKELADLVISTTQQVLKKTLDSREQKKLIKETITEVSKEKSL